MAANPIPQPLQLNINTTNGRSIVTCSGKLTAETAGYFKQEVKALIPKSSAIVLDLSDVSWMDSSGLGTLVGLYVSCRAAQKELRLINLNKRIAELLRITKLEGCFQGFGEYL